MISPANISAAHVEEFCSSLVKGEYPLNVCRQPAADWPERECFAVVEQRVSKLGGQRVLGWAIWERTGMFVEAEFHAVWRNPEGQLIDIVPRSDGFQSITFLPDPNGKYKGQQVENVRKPIVNDMDVVRYIFFLRRQFAILNTGDLANQYGDIALPDRLGREYRKLEKDLARLENRFRLRYP